MGSCLRNVLTISFHGVKFLLKPCCKHLSAFLDGGAILLDERGTNTCDTEIFVCLITREAGVLPTPGTGRAVTSNILQSCKKKSGTFWGQSSKGILLERASQCSLQFRGSPVEAEEIQNENFGQLLYTFTICEIWSEFGDKPDWDAFCSICSEEDTRTASHLSCRWHNPCCKHWMISCLSQVVT